MKILEVKNIGKSFHALKILGDVSFTITKGVIFAITGENGVGKKG